MVSASKVGVRLAMKASIVGQGRKENIFEGERGDEIQLDLFLVVLPTNGNG